MNVSEIDLLWEQVFEMLEQSFTPRLSLNEKPVAIADDRLESLQELQKAFHQVLHFMHESETCVSKWQCPCWNAHPVETEDRIYVSPLGCQNTLHRFRELMLDLDHRFQVAQNEPDSRTEHGRTYDRLYRRMVKLYDIANEFYARWRELLRHLVLQYYYAELVLHFESRLYQIQRFTREQERDVYAESLGYVKELEMQRGHEISRHLQQYQRWLGRQIRNLRSYEAIFDSMRLAERTVQTEKWLLTFPGLKTLSWRTDLDKRREQRYGRILKRTMQELVYEETQLDLFLLDFWAHLRKSYPTKFFRHLSQQQQLQWLSKTIRTHLQQKLPVAQTLCHILRRAAKRAKSISERLYAKAKPWTQKQMATVQSVGLRQKMLRDFRQQLNTEFFRFLGFVDCPWMTYHGQARRPSYWPKQISCSLPSQIQRETKQVWHVLKKSRGHARDRYRKTIVQVHQHAFYELRLFVHTMKLTFLDRELMEHQRARNLSYRVTLRLHAMIPYLRELMQPLFAIDPIRGVLEEWYEFLTAFPRLLQQQCQLESEYYRRKFLVYFYERCQEWMADPNLLRSDYVTKHRTKMEAGCPHIAQPKSGTQLPTPGFPKSEYLLKHRVATHLQPDNDNEKRLEKDRTHDRALLKEHLSKKRANDLSWMNRATETFSLFPVETPHMDLSRERINDKDEQNPHGPSPVRDPTHTVNHATSEAKQTAVAGNPDSTAERITAEEPFIDEIESLDSLHAGTRPSPCENEIVAMSERFEPIVEPSNIENKPTTIAAGFAF